MNLLEVYVLYFCVIAIPLFFLAFIRKSFSPIYAVGFLTLAVIFDLTIVLLPMMRVSSFHWNWEGKILESIWPLAVVYCFKWLTPEAVGIKSPKTKSGWLLGVVFGILYAVWACLDYFFWPEVKNTSFSIETIVYQLTLPGLAEELVFRGVYLAILNHYLGRQWKLFTTSFGWGAIMVTLLFIVGHLVIFTSNTFVVNFEWLNVYTISISCAFVYVREKTGSIWPCVIFHNLANGLTILFLSVLI